MLMLFFSLYNADRYEGYGDIVVLYGPAVTKVSEVVFILGYKNHTKHISFSFRY